MRSAKVEIFYLDFIESRYMPSELKTLTKEKWKLIDRSEVEASHPPVETIVISHRNTLIPASPFKIVENDDESKRIIEQNNYTNQSLIIIGKQLDTIETKIDKISSPEIKSKTKVEKPIVQFQDLQSSPKLKIKPTMKKIEEMLEQLTPSKAEKSGLKTLDSFAHPTESDLESIDSEISDISKIENAFKNLEVQVEPRVKKLEKHISPTSLTRNWYPRPTPPDIQFEERNLQTQFSVSSDKMYEWNIDGLPEQEIFNKLQHMSMVANSYITNHSFRQSEIVPLLVTGFTGTLRYWWDKHLTPESKNLIIHAVKLNEDGLPIFDEQVGQGIEDGVNTLLYTIIEHFIGTPSHTTARIHDQLSNLRCPKLSDFRWYKDVFISRVMLRDDSNQPFWKEKFVNGLPNLFAHKISTTLSNEQGHIDWDSLTYGNIISTINQVGMKMCIDFKIGKQIQSDRKSAKYELGNFCEQYGLASIPPSRKNKSSHFRKNRHYSRRKQFSQRNNDDREFYKKKKFSPKKNWSKGQKKSRSKKNNDKTKVKCFKCQKFGHYASECKVKDTIKQLTIADEDKEKLIKVLELRDSETSNVETLFASSESESDQSSDSQPSSPNIQIGCTDKCCNRLKSISVLTKQEEQEELLIDLISKIENPDLKADYLKKLRKVISQESPRQSTPQPISLNTTLERFAKKKEVTLQDLQLEVKMVKKEIVELKQMSHKLQSENYAIKQDLVLLMEKESSESKSQSESPHNSDEDPPEDQQVISLIRQINFRKWYSKVTIIVQNFEFTTVALFDSGADLKCIQEGLIPTKFYQKSRESLSTASGKSLQLNFEIPKAHVCQNKICFKTPFVLVKNITDEVILGLPFIALLYPFQVDYDGVISTYLGEKVKFEFLSKPELHNLRALQKQSVSKSIQIIRKNSQLNFLKEEIRFKRVEQQLSDASLQLQIQQFETKLKNEICADLPNAFWYRKQHVVYLPYIKTFSEKNIPTKARPIQMSQEIMEFCKKEIHELLEKKIIRKSKSPWSCPAFYVQKNAELERRVPRLVINYKPLNSVLEWIRYPIPNKRDLINRLEKAVIYSKFDMKSGFWQIQIHESDRYKTAFVTPFGHYEWNVMPFGLKNAPSEFQNIMNEIFNPYSHFSIVYIDDVLIFSESIEQHWKHLHKFLQIVKQNGLVVSAKKIKLFQTNIRFLGFNICQSQISPIDRVIQFADKFPDQILDKSQLQRFLGSLNYVSDFYQNLRKQCKPLFDRLQNNPPP
ncbi:unnamed protein product [Prunus armeniaca]